MDNLKAFSVTHIFNGYDIIIFEETRNRAKVLALSYEPEFEDCEYTDIRVNRFPEADKYATYKGSFEICENAEVFNSLGWGCETFELCDVKTCVLHEREVSNE